MSVFVLKVSILSRCVCWAIVALVPISLLAADPAPAILHAEGGVWVNGAEARDSTEIIPGDVLETKPGAIANLDADGSSILIQAESVVKYNGDSVTLEHGSVSVGTSTAMSVHVDCLRIVPVSKDRTQYDVTDVNGTLQVGARKLDVNILYGASTRKLSPTNGASQSTIVHEGQQVSRGETEACGTAKKPGATATSINQKWVEVGAGAGGVAILCALLCSGQSHPSVSPSKP
jgi:hypothetical protein